MGEIRIALLPKKIFESDGYVIYSMRLPGPVFMKAICKLDEPPPARKSTKYVLSGDFIQDNRYGKQFHIYRWERFKPKKRSPEEITDKQARRHLQDLKEAL